MTGLLFGDFWPIFFLVLDPTAGESYKTVVPGGRCCFEDSVTVSLLELSPRLCRFIYPEQAKVMVQEYERICLQ